jgi:class 3 adenylate cyclase
VTVCSSCSQENPDIAAFCLKCGNRLAQATPDHEERRVVTVIFVDIVGFTSQAERLDPEDVKAILKPYYEQVRAELESFGGVVEKFIGDAVMGVFGTPTTHGDDPERAVRAALAIRDAVADPGSDVANLSIRIAVNTGDALVSMQARPDQGEAMLAGDVVNTASRLQQAAPVNGILVGAETYACTRHVISYEPVPAVLAKGKSDPVQAWQAVEAIGEPGERPQIASPLIGRARELQVLDLAWSRVVTDRSPQLVTVFGPPGVGKTRLALEFARQVEAAGGRTLRGRTLPYQNSSAYGALAAQVKQLAGIFESDQDDVAMTKLTDTVLPLLGGSDQQHVIDNLAVLLGFGSQDAAADREALFFSVRCFVEALAQDRPTLLVFEDIHWANPGMLDLIEQLAARLHDLPVLLLTLARPELLDTRSGWAGGLLSYLAVPLEPLAPDSARDLARRLLAALDADEVEGHLTGLAETSEGNPLFIEQLAAALTERSAGGSVLPTTIRGIVAARLDALPAEERAVMLAASVNGRVFWRGALESSLDPQLVGHALGTLEARDLIRRDTTSMIKGEQQYAFKHSLIRDAAYETLPRKKRQEMHAEMARFIEGAISLEGESTAVLARHWRAAGEPGRAVDYLLAAADQAGRGWAKGLAFTLYGEALECAPPESKELIKTLQQRQAIAWQALMHVPDARHLGRGAEQAPVEAPVDTAP